MLASGNISQNTDKYKFAYLDALDRVYIYSKSKASHSDESSDPITGT